MRFKFNYNKKRIEINLRDCEFFGRFRGLMFRRKEDADVLLFDFKKRNRIALHSFFVFFPFIVVWLDEKNKVIETRKINSWKPIILPKKKFNKIVEIPINKKYKKVIRELNF